jgi:uncharacterized membrane protein
MRLLPLLLALAFPLLAHLAAATGSQRLAAAAVGCLALALAWPLRRRPAIFLVLLAALGAVLWLLLQRERAALLLLIPPVLFTAMVGMVFARSLRAGRVPLIERVVRVLHPEALQWPGVPDHLRRLTLGWAALLLGLAAVNLLLAACAVPGGLLHAAGIDPPLAVAWHEWSWFANVANYVLIGLAFVAEYAYRRWRWPESGALSFRQFATRMARLGPAFWRGG